MTPSQLAALLMIGGLLFVIFVIHVTKIYCDSLPKPIKNQATIPDVVIKYNKIRDLRVGEKGRIIAYYSIFVDEDHKCWLDTSVEITHHKLTDKFPDDLGMVEITRTETGYAAKLLTPDYKFSVMGRISNSVPVEKFEIVKEDE